MRWVLPAAVAVALVTTGCRSATAPERHVRPSGVLVTETGSGDEVVRVQGPTTTGTFVLTVAGPTPDLTFTFLDAQGNPLTPPGDYHLELRFAEETVAVFEHANNNPFSFRGRVSGLQQGATTVQIRLMHGPPGHVATHADYTSPAVAVEVG